jgi:hypothetical protein
MGQTQCPICYTPLEVREVATCEVCGDPDMEPFVPMDVWRFPNGYSLTVCGFCMGEEFGRPSGRGYRFGTDPTRRPPDLMKFVRRVTEPIRVKDKYCPKCFLRFAFLRFFFSAPAKNQVNDRCPECGSPMKLIHARGRYLLGCTTWATTKCKGTKPVNPS